MRALLSSPARRHRRLRRPGPRSASRAAPASAPRCPARPTRSCSTGSALPKLLGGAPAHVVGFAWDGSAWHQIPVQVDERDLVNPGQIYHRPTTIWPSLAGGGAYEMLVYTPPAAPRATGYTSAPTYTPSDSDPTFDGNDEVSFLANDTGKQAAGSVAAPAGVDATTPRRGEGDRPAQDVATSGTCTSSTATPSPAASAGHHRREVHVLVSTRGTTSPPTRWVTRRSVPNNSFGFNPEHSTVVTPHLPRDLRRPVAEQRARRHRRRRDGCDAARALALLRDRRLWPERGHLRRLDEQPGRGRVHRRTSPGPVRGIRSYLGANSYLYTANTHFFYPGREDLVTDVRGHAGLPGYGSADDYVDRHDRAEVLGPGEHGRADRRDRRTRSRRSPTSTGATAPPMWQMVSGNQGSVVTVRTLDTDISGPQRHDRVPGPQRGVAARSAPATRPRTARTA